MNSTESESSEAAIARIAAVQPSKPGMTNRKNPYLILGFAADYRGEWQHIQKRFRQLALLLHPDKVDLPGSEEAYKEVTAAFSYLQSKRFFPAGASGQTATQAGGRGNPSSSSRPASSTAPPARSASAGAAAACPARGAGPSVAGGAAVPKRRAEDAAANEAKKPKGGGGGSAASASAAGRPGQHASSQARPQASSQPSQGPQEARLRAARVEDVGDAARFVHSMRCENLEVRIHGLIICPVGVNMIQVTSPANIVQLFTLEEIEKDVEQRRALGARKAAKAAPAGPRAPQQPQPPAAPPAQQGASAQSRRDWSGAAASAGTPIDMDVVDDEAANGARAATAGGGTAHGAARREAPRPAGAAAAEADGVETEVEEEGEAAVPRGRALVGQRVRVWWDGGRAYCGRVTGYDPDELEHCVRYDDGEETQENLQGSDPVKWEFLVGGKDKMVASAKKQQKQQPKQQQQKPAAKLGKAPQGGGPSAAPTAAAGAAVRILCVCSGADKQVGQVCYRVVTAGGRQKAVVAETALPRELVSEYQRVHLLSLKLVGKWVRLWFADLCSYLVGRVVTVVVAPPGQLHVFYPYTGQQSWHSASETDWEPLGEVRARAKGDSLAMAMVRIMSPGKAYDAQGLRAALEGEGKHASDVEIQDKLHEYVGLWMAVPRPPLQLLTSLQAVFCLAPFDQSLNAAAVAYPASSAESAPGARATTPIDLELDDATEVEVEVDCENLSDDDAMQTGETPAQPAQAAPGVWPPAAPKAAAATQPPPGPAMAAGQASGSVAPFAPGAGVLHCVRVLPHSKDLPNSGINHAIATAAVQADVDAGSVAPFAPGAGVLHCVRVLPHSRDLPRSGVNHAIATAAVQADVDAGSVAPFAPGAGVLHCVRVLPHSRDVPRSGVNHATAAVQATVDAIPPRGGPAHAAAPGPGTAPTFGQPGFQQPQAFPLNGFQPTGSARFQRPSCHGVPSAVPGASAPAAVGVQVGQQHGMPHNSAQPYGLSAARPSKAPLNVLERSREKGLNPNHAGRSQPATERVQPTMWIEELDDFDDAQPPAQPQPQPAASAAPHAQAQTARFHPSLERILQATGSALEKAQAAQQLTNAWIESPDRADVTGSRLGAAIGAAISAARAAFAAVTDAGWPVPWCEEASHALTQASELIRGSEASYQQAGRLAVVRLGFGLNAIAAARQAQQKAVQLQVQRAAVGTPRATAASLATARCEEEKRCSAQLHLRRMAAAEGAAVSQALQPPPRQEQPARASEPRQRADAEAKTQADEAKAQANVAATAATSMAEKAAARERAAVEAEAKEVAAAAAAAHAASEAKAAAEANAATAALVAAAAAAAAALEAEREAAAEAAAAAAAAAWESEREAVAVEASPETEAEDDEMLEAPRAEAPPRPALSAQWRPSAEAEAEAELTEEDPDEDGPPAKLQLCRAAGGDTWWLVRDELHERFVHGRKEAVLGARGAHWPSAAALEQEHSERRAEFEESVLLRGDEVRALAATLLEVQEVIPWSVVKTSFAAQAFVNVVTGAELAPEARGGLPATSHLAHKLLLLEQAFKSPIRNKGWARRQWTDAVQAHSDNNGEEPSFGRRRTGPPVVRVDTEEEAAVVADALMALAWEMLGSISWEAIDGRAA